MKKTPDPKTELLQATAPFRSLSNRQLAAVASICDEVTFRPGDALVTQGAAGWECFVLASGTARVVVDGEPRDFVEAGDVVGEMALLDRAPRSASIVATTPVRAFVFGSREFATLLGDHAAVARHVTKHLTRRLRQSDQAVVAAG